MENKQIATDKQARKNTTRVYFSNNNIVNTMNKQQAHRNRVELY